MALIAFAQEPGHPEGLGTFHFDDGRTLFAHDPELAQTVPHPSELDPGIAQAAMGGPDERTAGNPFQTTDQRLDAGGPAPGVDDELAKMNFKAPQGPQAAPQAPAAPVQPQASVGGGPASPREAAPDPQAEAMKFITAPVSVGATRGGVIPKSQSQTIESDGVAYDEEHVASRQAANNDLMVARRNEAANQAHRAQAESLAHQARLPELQKQAAQAQQEQVDQHNNYKQERAHLEQMIQESQQAQKGFNANRWFESRGVVGQIGAVLAQAMGAYAATLGRGENWAQKIIDGAIQQDIAEQKEQIAGSKGNVDNALNRLKLRFGDMGQAEAALKLAMGKVADTQALAYAKSTGAQDIQDTWTKQVAQNQVDRVKEEQAFEAASKGKVKTTTDARIVAPSAGGTRAPTTAEMNQRADLAGKLPGIAEKTYNAELQRQKAMGEGGEEADKDRALVIEGLDGTRVLARRPEEATKIREQRGLQLSADKMARELEDLSGVNIDPRTSGKYKLKLEGVINTANTLFGQGVVKSDDILRYQDMLKSGPVGMASVARELRETLNNAYQSKVDAQMGQRVEEDYSKGGKARVRYGGAATTPTATPRGARELGE